MEKIVITMLDGTEYIINVVVDEYGMYFKIGPSFFSSLYGAMNYCISQQIEELAK